MELAEILFDGTRSKGCGVVQFAQVAEGETAIAKFQSYMYGGRPLGEFFFIRLVLVGRGSDVLCWIRAAIVG